MLRTALLLSLLLMTMSSNGSPVLTITTEQWPPNNYKNKQGKIVGKATERVRELMKKAGLEYKIELLPWVRAYNLAKRNPNTAVYSIMRTREREKHFQWVCPLIESTPVYVFRRVDRDDIIVERLEDLKNYMISVSRNEFDHHFLQANGFVAGKDFYIGTDDKTLVRKLISGRIDLMIGTIEAVNDKATQQGLDISKLTKIIELDIKDTNPTCLAFSLSTPKDIVSRVRFALDH